MKVDPDLAILHIRRSILRRIQDAGYPSLERFAFDHGLVKTTISRTIKGTRTPRLNTLFEIANALDIHIGELMDLPGLENIKPMKPKRRVVDTTSE